MDVRETVEIEDDYEDYLAIMAARDEGEYDDDLQEKRRRSLYERMIALA